MSNDIIVPIIELARDGAYVALFAYGINRASAYATRRLEIYGQQGDYFPPREGEELEEEEEIILTRGSRDVKGREKRIGFTGVLTHESAPETEDADEDEPTPAKRTRRR